ARGAGRRADRSGATSIRSRCGPGRAIPPRFCVVRVLLCPATVLLSGGGMVHRRSPALAAGAVVASFVSACGSGRAPAPGAPEAVVETQAALQPAGAASSFCGHVRGGLPSSKAPLIALSEAHASVRYFGANDSFTSADQALAKALARPFTPRRDVLDTYVAALGNGQSCVAQTSNDDLGP